MGSSTGTFKQVAMKRETAYGVAPTPATGAQIMRRVQSTFDLNKDTYQSNEIRTDFQVSDMRHGVRRVAGTLQGELSPGSYAEVFAQLCKRDFTAGATAAAVGVTIAGTGPTYTVTRGTGSFLTDLFKVGDIFRMSVGGLNAANINRNLLILALTATVATVMVLSNTSLVAEGPIAGVTITVIGKKTWAPLMGHTDISFALEHWFADVPSNELFLGVKFAKAAIALPPTGMATAQFDGTGKDMTPSPTRYYTTPTAALTTGVTAAVNGALMVGGALLTNVTGLNFDLMDAFSGDPVVGSNTVPSQFAGSITASGQFTAYFDSTTLRDAFINESEISLVVALTSDNSATSNALSFTFPRIKLSSAGKDDAPTAIKQTIGWTALLNFAGGAGQASEATTFTVQDTAA